MKASKFEKGDKVILLDFSNETSSANREYNHFWVEPMTKFIGSIFTIKQVNMENGSNNLFWYKMDVDKNFANWGFNEHWLQELKPLDDKLFEI